MLVDFVRIAQKAEPLEKVRMVDSPLGKIPEGWGLATFAEVLSDLESGSRPKGGIDSKILKGNIWKMRHKCNHRPEGR